MSSFSQTINPTPFAFFDSDATFQSEADGIVVFVKRKLGDDVLSVELTSKMIWACFEEATCEYSRIVHEQRIKSDLVNMLGLPTGSTDLTNKYPRATMEFIMRQADAYASWAGIGGSYEPKMGYFELVDGQQDYNLYTDLLDAVSGSVLYDSVPSGSKGKMRVRDVFHFEPLAAQNYLVNGNNVTNFLANEFSYETYTTTTVFYVLPVFEDVLRRSMLETAFRVRRSNYSYEIMGSKIRIYPIPQPTHSGLARLYVRVFDAYQNAYVPTSYNDDTIYGISGINNVPFGNIPFSTITQPGRQWIRQYTLALAKGVLGRVRSKMRTIPVPNAELTLDGPELLQQADAEKEKLTTDLKELLGSLTTQSLLDMQANQAENLNRILRYAPIRAPIRMR